MLVQSENKVDWSQEKYANWKAPAAIWQTVLKETRIYSSISRVQNKVCILGRQRAYKTTELISRVTVEVIGRTGLEYGNLTGTSHLFQTPVQQIYYRNHPTNNWKSLSKSSGSIWRLYQQYIFWPPTQQPHQTNHSCYLSNHLHPRPSAPLVQQLYHLSHRRSQNLSLTSHTLSTQLNSQ